MNVQEAIKYIELFKFKNLPKFKPELITLLKALEAENKALKKENQAYREMWKSICGYINNFHKDSTTSGILDTRKVIENIEQKYLNEEVNNDKNSR